MVLNTSMALSNVHVYSLIPSLPNLFQCTHVTLKNWDGPGDEATCLHSEGLQYISGGNWILLTIFSQISSLQRFCFKAPFDSRAARFRGCIDRDLHAQYINNKPARTNRHAYNIGY